MSINPFWILGGACAVWAIVLTFVFVVYYTALDSIGGFGVARTIINTKMMEAKGELTDQAYARGLRVKRASRAPPVTVTARARSRTARPRE